MTPTVSTCTCIIYYKEALFSIYEHNTKEVHVSSKNFALTFENGTFIVVHVATVQSFMYMYMYLAYDYENLYTV